MKIKSRGVILFTGYTTFINHSNNAGQNETPTSETPISDNGSSTRYTYLHAMLFRFQSGIKHIQRHLITFLCSRDRDESFIAIFCWLIDFTRRLAQFKERIGGTYM